MEYAQKKVFIEAHIVFSSSLNIPGINPNDVVASIEQLKTIYSNTSTGITFELGSTDYLDNLNYVNVVRGDGEEHSQQAEELFNLFTKPGVIHVIFVPALDQQGVAYDIPSRKIIIANGSALNNETLAHEMGHCLGLHHTYRGSENVTRNVNSPYYNATTEGDLLHDTPADPVNNINKISPFIYNCEFTNPSQTHSPPPENALYVDPQGVLVKNIMSLPKFNPYCSRYAFTAGQINRMNELFLNENGHLADLLNNVKTSVTNKFGDVNITNSTLTINSRSYNSGDFAYLKHTNTHIGKTDNERFYNFQSNNIKHHDWNSDNLQYHQTKDFNVSAQNNFRYAYFSPMNPITAINSMAESSIFFNADIEFKDPWYLFTGNVQQSDQNNAWIPNTNPNWLTGAFDQTTGGVFLNQEYIPSQPNKPHYSIRVPHYQDKLLSQTGKIHRFYLNNWIGSGPVNLVSPNSNESPAIFFGSGSILTANMKGTQLSNEQNAYSNNSQRKFVRTNNGHLHNVYSSMNRIWYERSTNNGASWEIMNDGKPLDDNPCKSPSIDFLDYLYSQDQIIIAYQQFDGENTNIIIEIFENGAKQSHNVAVSFDDTYFVYDLNPVISWHYSGRILLVYKGLNGLFFRYGNLVGTQQTIQWYGYPTFIVGTTANARNLSLVGLNDFYNNLLPFHLAWEEDFEIKYKMLSSSGSNYNSITQHQTEIISAQAGFRRHSHPSIIVWSDNSVRICWIGERGPDGLPNYTEGQEKTVVFTDPGTPNRFWTFGNGVTSTSINKTNDKYAIAWASGNNNLITFADNSTLRPVGTINISGKDVQLSNGTTANTMYALVFNTNALPYYMQTGLVNFNQQQEIEPIEVREGIVSEEEAQVYFNIGDVMVDNEQINFVEIPDTVSITSQQTANQYLVSETFSLTDNSEFFYSVKYGLTDSLAALSMLSSNKSLTFKVELLDAVTNEILGVFDEVTYDQGNIIPYEKVDYQVLTNGIGTRTVKLRLVINSNFSPDYSVAEKYDTESSLAKKNYKQINFQGNLEISEFSLAQNYPNPFNPSTTINYQIKEDGLVTLKLYDILGSEVRTLVNENKTKGRYVHNFNGSELASGVYIYQLRVNAPSASSGQSFVSSKKLMLLK